MSLELHALLDEGEKVDQYQDDLVEQNRIHNINPLPNNQSPPSDQNDATQTTSTTTTTTPHRRHNIRSPHSPPTELQKQRKETHLELIRYPGWNYFLNLQSESTVLFISVLITSLRFFGPLCNDILNLFYYIFSIILFSSSTSTTPPSNLDSITINDPYLESNPIPLTPSLLTFNSFSDRSIMPLFTFLFTLFIFTQIPRLKRYVNVHQALNISTSMPFPPPALHLAHQLIILLCTFSIDFFCVGYFEYRLLYQLYNDLPTPIQSVSVLFPILLQGFMIIVYLIFVIGQICLVLLMLTECYCLFQSQKWWINYTSTFQTKKRCFIVGNFTQIHLFNKSQSQNIIISYLSFIILYIRIYISYFKHHFIYYFKYYILRQTQLTPPTIFPYPHGDRTKFKHLIYKRFPFLRSQTLTPVNSPTSSTTTPSPTTTTTTPHQHHNCSHHSDSKPCSDHLHDTDEKDDNATTNDDGNNNINDDIEQTSLLGSNNQSSEAPTLVVPCVILPPYIHPINQPILKLFFHHFALQLIEWIKSYRESVQTVGRQSQQDGNNNGGPAY